jgi:hypothetical protein
MDHLWVVSRGRGVIVMPSLMAAGIVVLCAVVAVVLTVLPWTLVRRRRRGRATAAALATGGPLPVRALDDDAELHHAEARLLADLLAGRIDRASYLNAMTRLAAVDEPRHPVAVPGDPI